VGGERHVPAALPPTKSPGTHCTGSWVGARTGRDGCGKSRFHWDSNTTDTFPYLHAYLKLAIGISPCKTGMSVQMLLSYRGLQTDNCLRAASLTVLWSHKFPDLSWSLHKRVSIPVWRWLLTYPGDVKLLKLYSRVGKPDVWFLRCGSCPVTERDR
jgi:hypothetical protein